MLRLPPHWIVFSCLFMFGMGELAGALLGGYPQQISGWAQRQAGGNPQIHGLVGVPDIDRAILDEMGSEVLARLHTFHLHAHGLALVVFAVTLILASVNIRRGVRKTLMGLTCLGLIYPFGWLLMAVTVPQVGKENSFAMAEKLFFIPFGGAFLLIIWMTIGIYLGAALSGKFRETA